MQWQCIYEDNHIVIKWQNIFLIPATLGSGDVEFLIPDQGYFHHSAQTVVPFMEKLRLPHKHSHQQTNWQRRALL